MIRDGWNLCFAHLPSLSAIRTVIWNEGAFPQVFLEIASLVFTNMLIGFILVLSSLGRGKLLSSGKQIPPPRLFNLIN